MGRLAALLGLLLAGVPASADFIQDLGATVQIVAGELATAFPKVEVTVAAVEGDVIRVEGSGVATLRPGLELGLFRRGEVFRHPITGQPLGHGEQELGTLVVTEVQTGRATGRLVGLPGRPPPAPGDGARISAGRLPVAVLPTAGVTGWFEDSDQLQLLLVARFSAVLERTGRFLPVESQRVLDLMARGDGTGVSSPRDVAKRLGAPAVLSSRIVSEGGRRVLEAEWLSERTGAVLATVRTPIVRASMPPRFAWEETPELGRRFEVDGPVRGVAVADLDGDGQAELVVGDDRVIEVYRWRDGALTRHGATYRPGGTILSVDAGDINGAGRAQIVVVEQRGENFISGIVLELGRDGLRVIETFRDRLLRIVSVDGRPWLLSQLLAQLAARDELLDPFARRLVWRGSRYEEDSSLRLPSGISIYGLALVRLTGQEQPDVVALTADDRLSVWTARGQRVWSSGEHYGGASVSFPYTPIGGPREARDVVIGRVVGRILPLPAAGPGGDILVFENILPVGGQARSGLPGLSASMFTQGRIHRLRWQNNRFLRVWSSQPTAGYIGDLGYGDVDGDGFADVAVGVTARGFTLETLNPLARAKAWIVTYELP